MNDEEEVRFGDFRLDLRRRELTKAGQPIRLGSRAFEILCLLASARGNVVSKDQLLERVWPGVVIEENALHVHISGLRKALDTGGSGPGFIFTAQGRGYRLAGVEAALPAAAEPDHPGEAPALPDRPSIAVLPFYNMSDDVAQEYFADGIVEDIITGLSRIEWLFVIARNSSFIFKGRAADVTQIGRDLGVRYVLEGSVRRAGNRVRLTAQLVEARTRVHMWAERYDRLLDDIFAVQDEITMSVIGAIEPSLRRVEIERVRRTALTLTILCFELCPLCISSLQTAPPPPYGCLPKRLNLNPIIPARMRCWHAAFTFATAVGGCARRIARLRSGTPAPQ
jgi:TolB-like protein